MLYHNTKIIIYFWFPPPEFGTDPVFALLLRSSNPSTPTTISHSVSEWFFCFMLVGNLMRRCFTPIVAMVVWYWCEHHTHYNSNIRYAAFASNFTTHLDACLCELSHCSPVAGRLKHYIRLHSCCVDEYSVSSAVAARKYATRVLHGNI